MQSIEGGRRKFKGSAYLNLNDVFQVFLVCDISSAAKTSHLLERKKFLFEKHKQLCSKKAGKNLNELHECIFRGK